MARGKGAPEIGLPMCGASDLALVLAVAAMALGLTIVVAGVALGTVGALPIPAQEALATSAGPSPHLRTDGTAGLSITRMLPRTVIHQQPRQLTIATDRLSTQLYVHAPEAISGQRDRRQTLHRAAALARRNWQWLDPQTSCRVDPCSLASAMPGSWVPRP